MKTFRYLFVKLLFLRKQGALKTSDALKDYITTSCLGQMAVSLRVVHFILT